MKLSARATDGLKLPSGKTDHIVFDDDGIQPHIIEAVLNHVSGHKSGVAGIYNRSVYAAEKAQALALQAEHVMSNVENREAKVLPIAKRT